MANRKITALSDEQLIKNVIPLAVEYRRRFGKSLGITSEVGEYKASQLMHLKRMPGNINEGYDAIDDNGKRVQIKSRIYHRKQERTGLFKNFKFDYALLVLLSQDYQVTDIYKASRKRIEEQITAQKYKRPSLAISKFIKLGKQVYP